MRRKLIISWPSAGLFSWRLASALAYVSEMANGGVAFPLALERRLLTSACLLLLYITLPG